MAEYENLRIQICLNKIDLGNQEGGLIADGIRAKYNVIKTSTNLEKALIIEKFIERNITVFAGPSGVGKSSLINK